MTPLDDGATKHSVGRVVVIGATGNVGTAVVRALAADSRVDAVVGVARRVPTLMIPKTEWHAADIETDALDVIDGAAAVIHLAWKIQPQRDERAMARTNIDGTRRVLDAVARHHVPVLVYASSVGAYSPGPKDRAVDESWPAHGIGSSIYSRHKAAVESMLDEFEINQRDIRVVRLRTSLVFQGGAASEIHRLFLGPLVPWHLPRRLRVVPRHARLAFQATHASDVAEAYRLATLTNVNGAFNIAADPVLNSDRLAAAVGGRSLPVPARMLRLAMSTAYRAHLIRAEAGWLDMALQTPVMDTGRARSVLGWTPARSAVDAFVELTDAIGRGEGLPTAPLSPRTIG
jgi:nucleoside-diphosphate-sugar epimerase